MSFHEIDDTLVDYFKQMLLEEEEQTNTVCDKSVQNTDNTIKAAEDDEFDIDTSSLVEHQDDNSLINLESKKTDEASVEVDTQEPKESDDNYFSSPMDEDTLSSSLAHFQQMANIEPVDIDANEEQVEDSTASKDPEVMLNQETKADVANLKPYAEPHPIEKLLEKVDSKTETEVEEKVEVVQEEKIETLQEQVVAKSEDKVVEAKEATESEDNAEPKEEWHNIELPKEFQALFFLVKGIRFAVPLVNLGGIFQSEKITPLFGKPKWFMGIADIRGKKMNVVDTLKWVKSDAPDTDNYEYKIALDKTLWSIGCDELEGNRILSNDSVTWRQQAGNRPWLAGIVKKEMCALLHVQELIKMFEKGVNLKDLELQMSE